MSSISSNAHKPLTLRQKIGQLFICGFDAIEPNPAITQLIEEYGLGGVIYFRRNVKDAHQLAHLSAKLQEISHHSGGQPLFIAVDQEGGMVSRIEKGATLLPGNMALGAAFAPAGVYASSKIMGKELRQMGVNMNFAPCLDINNNPLNPVIGVRSYGETAAIVGDMGTHAVKGLQDMGVIATVKHFPGHGDTSEDSHHDLPVVPHSMERLMELELAPFIKAIEGGVDAIMTAHVVFAALEQNGVPSTLSYRILTELLREELNFKGLIVTDCLEMKAISEGIGVAEGAVRAIEAGSDLILVSHTLERQVSAMEAVIAAVESGRIPESRIDASVLRVMTHKYKREIQFEKLAPIPEGPISTPEHQLLAKELSRKSITLVKDEVGMLLDMNESPLVIWTEVQTGTEIDEVVERQGTLGRALAELTGSDIQEVYLGIYPSESEITATLQAAEGKKQVVMVTYNATFSPGQTQLVKALAAIEDLHLIVAAGRNPYDLLEFPEVKTYFACYENRPLAMVSLANVLLGHEKPVGRLPVTLSEQYAIGWRLEV
ncbi:beta-N-acetylhexosaminidase [Paenibacillus sp. CGMCC 1.16610]|uniref:Beta-N-acetylhexosaminidase n=1 Tax=Paenibacillus anseongense TaxID=2682845 RepID=A0ABW9U4Y4_9BACL|nr:MULTISPECIES: beta-N-acetylhexosaminidase [Paenibacillus]MBA2939205.1 beta-N-acetylhexosaminidase [Paenibacillus sp. CGMCC 1.16610]MVQ35164.1 beta-N-acetylhexosaminidase [Paenibacillus anseongense]